MITLNLRRKGNYVQSILIDGGSKVCVKPFIENFFEIWFVERNPILGVPEHGLDHDQSRVEP